MEQGSFEFPQLESGKDYVAHFIDPKTRQGATAAINSNSSEITVQLQPCGQAKARFVNAKGEPLAKRAPRMDLIVNPGVDQYDKDTTASGKILADMISPWEYDKVNYSRENMPRSNSDGEIILPALIPGATYRVITCWDDRTDFKEFVAKSGETIDLGNIVIPPRHVDGKPNPSPPMSEVKAAEAMTNDE